MWITIHRFLNLKFCVNVHLHAPAYLVLTCSALQSCTCPMHILSWRVVRCRSYRGFANDKVVLVFLRSIIFVCLCVSFFWRIFLYLLILRNLVLFTYSLFFVPPPTLTLLSVCMFLSCNLFLFLLSFLSVCLFLCLCLFLSSPSLIPYLLLPTVTVSPSCLFLYFLYLFFIFGLLSFPSILLIVFPIIFPFPLVFSLYLLRTTFQTHSLSRFSFLSLLCPFCAHRHPKRRRVDVPRRVMSMIPASEEVSSSGFSVMTCHDSYR